MLNTKKLLYILPDTAYIAELLPTKKPHSFTVQSFRQINGEFLDDNEFLAENIEKLIKKIEPDTYSIILPDFLFTNTIIDIAETEESAVKKQLKEKLLPSLNLSKETHEIDTFILTQHQGKSKVQLSALEKSLLDPLRKACHEQKVLVDHISPLSWSIKSVVSLEPSLSTIQMGGMLYLAQHYIGIDQAISFKIADAGNIIETVKTLKGAEPNIQTMYLLTNALIEQELKEKLSGTLPMQQLANYADEQEGMPAFIRHIIEASAKTLDISEYPVPRFSLGKHVASAAEAAPVVAATKTEEPAETKAEVKEEKIEVKSLSLDEEPPMPISPVTDLPKPNLPVADPVVEPAKVETVKEEVKIVEEQKEPMKIEPPAPVVIAPPAPSIETPPAPVITPPPTITIDPAPSVKPAEVSVTPAPTVTAPTISAPASSDPNPVITSLYGGTAMNEAVSPNTTPAVTPVAPARTVLKNKNDTSSLLKVIVVTIGALIVTVAVGVGIGFGVLKLSDRNSPALNQTPVVESSPTPTIDLTPTPPASASASPTASGSATTRTINSKEAMKILVVNATGIAGKAGTFKGTLTKAGYTSVDTGNAKGTYTEKATIVLLNDAAKPFLSALEKDAGVTLSQGDDKAVEDAKNAYDVVIVLNE